jgi:hypothetical protein
MTEKVMSSKTSFKNKYIKQMRKQKVCTLYFNKIILIGGWITDFFLPLENTHLFFIMLKHDRI